MKARCYGGLKECGPREIHLEIPVLDSFRGHTVDNVKNRLIEKNTNIAIIPGGCTSKLQPLDVSINKSFKSKVN